MGHQSSPIKKITATGRQRESVCVFVGGGGG